MAMNSQPRRQGAVASPHAVASRVGADVLEAGGNALDAAVATNAMLGVVYPHMCGFGGDTFILYHSAAERRVHYLNGSGPAPALASREEFRRRGLDAIPARGPLPVTVPGTVAAWEEALGRFGTRPLGELLAAAADGAEQGIEVTGRLAAWIETYGDELAGDPVLARWFLPGGRPLSEGSTLRQPELGRSLRRLMEHGGKDMYEGEIAREIDAAFRSADGLLRQEDLARYAPEWGDPISLSYRGLEVYTTPPNSQGITALMMLNALQVLGADRHSPGSPDHIEALVRAKRFAFAERDRHITDPKFLEAPVERLLDLDHARDALAAPTPADGSSGGGDTVYLCTSDADGNACSVIQSIFYTFGAAFVPGDTGILMQNRGHYFSLDDDHPNRLEPGKRTLHTLMASMAFEGDDLRLVFGTMGADGQAQTTVQVLERYLDGNSPQEAVAAPRILHGRFLPDDDPTRLNVEERMGSEVIDELTARGHDPHVFPPYDERLGHAHAIELAADGSTRAGSDPRSDGAAIVVD